MDHAKKTDSPFEWPQMRRPLLGREDYPCMQMPELMLHPCTVELMDAVELEGVWIELMGFIGLLKGR